VKDSRSFPVGVRRFKSCPLHQSVSSALHKVKEYSRTLQIRGGTVAKVKDHLKSAEEFYALGSREYEEGRRKGDLTRMREGCEKIFHAYVEATAALVQKRGFPEPDSHGERWEILDKLGRRKLVEVGDSAFLYLHQYGYYGGKMRPEVEKTMKDVKEAIDYVRKEVTHES